MTLIKDHANVIDTPNLPFTSNKRVVSEPYIKFLKRAIQLNSHRKWVPTNTQMQNLNKYFIVS